MTWLGKFREAFLDSTGAFSMSRLIAFFGTVVASYLTLLGSIIAVYEVVKKSTTSVGLSFVGLGIGFFASGAALKFGSKVQEAKIETSSKSE